MEGSDEWERGAREGGRQTRRDWLEWWVDAVNNLPNSIAVLCKNRLTDGSDQLTNRSKTGLSEGLTNSG